MDHLPGVRQLQRDVLPLRPRVITIYDGWNDHWIGFGLPDPEVARLLRRTGSRWQDVAWSNSARRPGSPSTGRTTTAGSRSPISGQPPCDGDGPSGGAEPVLITAPTLHEKGRSRST